MPLKIVRNDITKMKVEAIVNPTNILLRPGGGIDKAIHQAAGVELSEKCQKIGHCSVGDVVVTKGYHLPVKYIIHTVGPIYKDGQHHEEELLKSCYLKALKKADWYRCKSMAIPLISTGSYGYPKNKVLKIATDCISSFLLNHDMDIYLVVYDKESYQLSEELFNDIKSYIDDNYIKEDFLQNRIVLQEEHYLKSKLSLDEVLNRMDETFSEMLLRKIDESGMKDSECYKKANIDRKLFSKIRKDKNYKPRKQTVLAFAIALKLSLEETDELLLKAGYALSHSHKFDVIVEYFIENQNYDIFEINEALFTFDQPLLG